VSDRASDRGLSRRTPLAGATGLATWALLPDGSSAALPQQPLLVPARAAANPTVDVHLAATDGWVSMPEGAPPIAPFWPDPLAPTGSNIYVFGFRDVTGFSASALTAERGKALRLPRMPSVQVVGPAWLLMAKAWPGRQSGSGTRQDYLSCCCVWLI
jgi:hypothetical protein